MSQTFYIITQKHATIKIEYTTIPNIYLILLTPLNFDHLTFELIIYNKITPTPSSEKILKQ